MAEMIVGLSKSNAEMRTTLRYLDQIQRSTERLGRVRYQSLIKVNNEPENDWTQVGAYL